MFSACFPFPFQCGSRCAVGSGLMNDALDFAPVSKSVNDFEYLELNRLFWIQSSTLKASTRSHFVVSVTTCELPRNAP